MSDFVSLYLRAEFKGRSFYLRLVVVIEDRLTLYLMYIQVRTRYLQNAIDMLLPK